MASSGFPAGGTSGKAPRDFSLWPAPQKPSLLGQGWEELLEFYSEDLRPASGEDSFVTRALGPFRTDVPCLGPSLCLVLIVSPSALPE